MKNKEHKRERISQPREAARSNPKSNRHKGKAPKGEAEKHPSATLCPECGAVYSQGRWHWTDVADPSGDAREVCPACRRIRDADPAGEIRISGDFARAHREEIVSRVRNVEAREKTDHPLQRVMQIREESETLVVTTTDAHLVNAIG